MDDLIARIDEIRKHASPPKRRAAHGKWTGPGWVVRGLVEKHGYGVIDAVREVVRQEGHEPADIAERSIRQAYYNLKEKPWPSES